MSPYADNAQDAVQMLKSLRAQQEDVDLMVNQLTRGNYLTVSTFANNLIHLNRAFEPIQAAMAAPGVLATLLREDVLLTADLIATGRAIAIMNNFFCCITAQNDSRQIRGKGVPF